MLFFLLISTFHFTSSTLISVSAICRHGDRWPQISIPNYPGAGNPEQLTEKGMWQHRTVGESIRKHYADLFSDTYSEDETYIRVSNYDRCFLSAQSQFYGIYSSNAENKTLSFPMYSELQNSEALLRGFDVCLKCLRPYYEYQQSKEYKDLIESLQPTFDTLSQEINYTVDASNMEKVLDAMLIKSFYGELTPTEEACRANLSVASDTIRPHYFNAEVDDWIVGSEGLLLEELFRVNPKADLEATGKQKKYRLYSAHDSTVYSFLHALGYNITSLPYYAATVFIELHLEDATNKPYLEFNYQPDLEATANYTQLWNKITVKGCPSEGNCYLDDFVSVWGKYMANVSESSPFDTQYVDPTQPHNLEYNVNTNPLADFLANHCEPKNALLRPLTRPTKTESEGLSKSQKDTIVVSSSILFVIAAVLVVVGIVFLILRSRHSRSYQPISDINS